MCGNFAPFLHFFLKNHFQFQPCRAGGRYTPEISGNLVGWRAEGVYEVFEGSSLKSRFPMATGLCSPALPTSVYDRSNLLGPSTFISQSSFARDPTIDTRHSPGRPLRTCSMIACTSLLIVASPVLCSSTNTDISFPFYKDASVDAAQLVFSSVAVQSAYALERRNADKMFMKSLGFFAV